MLLILGRIVCHFASAAAAGVVLAGGIDAASAGELPNVPAWQLLGSRLLGHTHIARSPRKSYR